MLNGYAKNYTGNSLKKPFTQAEIIPHNQIKNRQAQNFNIASTVMIDASEKTNFKKRLPMYSDMDFTLPVYPGFIVSR